MRLHGEDGWRRYMMPVARRPHHRWRSRFEARTPASQRMSGFRFPSFCGGVGIAAPLGVRGHRRSARCPSLSRLNPSMRRRNMPTRFTDDDLTAVADHLRSILAAIPASDDSPRDRPTRHRLQGCLIAFSRLCGVDPLSGERLSPPPITAPPQRRGPAPAPPRPSSVTERVPFT